MSQRRGRMPWRSVLVGLGVAAITYVFSLRFLLYVSPGWLVAGYLAVWRPYFWVRWGKKGLRSANRVHTRRAEKHSGIASRLDRLLYSSIWAMRVRWANSLCPWLFTKIKANRADDLGVDLKGNPIEDEKRPFILRRPFIRLKYWLKYWWAVLRSDARLYAARLGMDNYGGYWIPNNSVTIRIAGPRSGKSYGIIDRVAKHIGPVISTSTRTDIMERTRGYREHHGSKCYLFNAGDVGYLASDIKWSILSGCENYVTAMRRAKDLIGEPPSSQQASWYESASAVLGPLMFVAATAGGRFRNVTDWILSDQPGEALAKIRSVLRRTQFGQTPIPALDQFFGMGGKADTTRESVKFTLMRATGWANNEIAAEIGDPPAGGEAFDILQDIIMAGATVYVLGSQDNPSVASLTGAFIAEIVDKAREYAETQPRGRLRVPMLMALDELPLTCRGPVQHWTKDMGGRNMPFDLGIQSRAGLDEVWGAEGRRTIINNALVRLVGPGLGDTMELSDWAKLSGSRVLKVRNYDSGGKKVISQSERVVPVFDVDQIAQLQTGRFLAFSRGPLTLLNTPNIDTDKKLNAHHYSGEQRTPTMSETNRKKRTSSD